MTTFPHLGWRTAAPGVPPSIMAAHLDAKGHADLFDKEKAPEGSPMSATDFELHRWINAKRDRVHVVRVVLETRSCRSSASRCDQCRPLRPLVVPKQERTYFSYGSFANLVPLSSVIGKK